MIFVRSKMLSTILRPKKAAIDREERFEPEQGITAHAADSAAYVGQRGRVEEKFHQLGDGVVTPFEKEPHVGALPDQLLDRSTAVDDFEVLGVGEELSHVVTAKRSVRLRYDNQIPGHFPKSPPDRGSVALTQLVDLARRGSHDFLARAGGRVVVDDDDLVDDAGHLVLLDRRANRVELVVGRQNQRDRLPAPHDQARPATTYIWAASGRTGRFR